MLMNIAEPQPDTFCVSAKLKELAVAYNAFLAMDEEIRQADKTLGRATIYSADLSELNREYHRILKELVDHVQPPIPRA